MRVMIYEPYHSGHHLADLSKLLPGILELGVEVVLVTTRETVRSNEYSVTLGPLRDRLHIEEFCRSRSKSASPGFATLVATAVHHIRECRAAAKKFNPDHIYIMMGDGMWEVMQVLRYVGWRAFSVDITIDTFLISGKFTHPESCDLVSTIKRWLFNRMLRSDTFDGIYVLDELLHQYSEAFVRNDRGPMCLLSPLPVAGGPEMSVDAARRALRLNSEGRLLSHVGVIGRHKGTARMLAAFARYLEVSSGCSDRLLLAGPHSDNIIGLLQHEPYASLVDKGQIVSIDRYLDSDQMYLCAAAGNVMTVGMHNHVGRSSTILWAAAAGRPVVTTETGCIGHVVEKNHLGLTCDVTDVAAFSRQLGAALNMVWTDDDAARVRAYAEFHSIENYRKVGTSVLRRRVSGETVNRGIELNEKAESALSHKRG